MLDQGGNAFDAASSGNQLVKRYSLNQLKNVFGIAVSGNVIFNSDTPGKSYWLEIISLQNENKNARMEAQIIEQQIILETSNISDYQIYLNSTPILLKEEITIIENGNTIFNGKLEGKGIFKKSSKNNEPN